MAKVFINYSHEDEEWIDWLQSHLSVLAKQGKLAIWEDRHIQTADDLLPGNIATMLRLQKFAFQNASKTMN